MYFFYLCFLFFLSRYFFGPYSEHGPLYLTKTVTYVVCEFTAGYDAHQYSLHAHANPQVLLTLIFLSVQKEGNFIKNYKDNKLFFSYLPHFVECSVILLFDSAIAVKGRGIPPFWPRAIPEQKQNPKGRACLQAKRIWMFPLLHQQMRSDQCSFFWPSSEKRKSQNRNNKREAGS